jgi:NitT/TauT family transport system substrate-binding protein
VIRRPAAAARSKSAARCALLACAFACMLAAPARADEPVIRLGNLKLAHFAAVSYIKELAPKCGIRVEEKVFAKGPDILQAMLAGELEVGATASEASIAGRANGAPIYIVAGFASGGVRILSRADLGLKTIEELKGRKVGVTRGSIQEVLLAAELGKHGLTFSDQPGKDVQLVYLLYPDLNVALLQKSLDAICQTEPQSSKALSDGFAKEILKPYDTPVGVPVRTLVMTAKFHDQSPQQAQKFMDCFVAATRLFMEDKALASRYVRETLFKGQISPADFDAAIGNSPYGFEITAEHVQVTADTMFKYGVGKMKAPPKASEFVRLELLEAAKAKAGAPKGKGG